MTSAEIQHHWLEEFLPLWRDHGYDWELGGFHNRLGLDLRPAPDPFKRLLVQCRQVWTFSVAAQRGAGAWALELAQRGHAFLREHLLDVDKGGYFLTCTLEGQPLDRSKDLYTHAFVLLALAEHHRASGSNEVLEQARECFVWLDEHLRDPLHGGFFEAAEPDWTARGGARRRQNPHMHLFEALLVLNEVDPQGSCLAECSALFELLCERFLDSETGALCEFFEPDWSHCQGLDGQVVEPGHSFEWAWLLRRYARAANEPAAEAQARRFFAFGSAHGLSEQGGVYDELNRAGRVTRQTQRLWPQTERIHALAELVSGGEATHLDTLHAALRTVFDNYVSAEHHGWAEQRDREGRISSTSMNATSVYHVTGALTAAIDSLDRGEGPV
ncbi:MAG: hypothetical protein GY946_26720 [bacterium]|nr:hypothetical protein [bacterium]